MVLSWNKKGGFNPDTKMMFEFAAVQSCTNSTVLTTEFKFDSLAVFRRTVAK